MVDGLLRLGHDVVIGSHNDNGNVGNLSSTSTHSGESLVTRSIEEGHMATVVKSHVVSSYVLCDTTGFTSDDISLTDVVEQRCLTMIDMSHHGYDGSTGLQILFTVLSLNYSLAYFCTYIFSSVAILFGNEVNGFSIHALVDADHDTDGHTCTNNLRYGHIHHRCQFVGGNKLGKLQHFALGGLLFQFLLHTLADSIALFTAILSALTQFVVLIRESSQCLAYLLGHFLVAYFLRENGLFGLVLLFLLTLALTLLLVVGLLLLIAVLVVATLLLVCNSIHIDTLLPDTCTLLLVALLLLTLLSLLLLRFLLGTSALVHGREVDVTFYGK